MPRKGAQLAKVYVIKSSFIVQGDTGKKVTSCCSKDVSTARGKRTACLGSREWSLMALLCPAVTEVCGEAS